ncbi:hypothetical protein Syun_007687 [Stephania yunnanensis]|uniref:Uncharacterized protein n=1 Tax=Stephania yunnanensis TaxID=152371 RepID=A0AAP0KZ17_9MAGN
MSRFLNPLTSFITILTATVIPSSPTISLLFALILMPQIQFPKYVGGIGGSNLAL